MSSGAHAANIYVTNLNVTLTSIEKSKDKTNLCLDACAVFELQLYVFPCTLRFIDVFDSRIELDSITWKRFRKNLKNVSPFYCSHLIWPVFNSNVRRV